LKVDAAGLEIESGGSAMDADSVEVDAVGSARSSLPQSGASVEQTEGSWGSIAQDRFSKNSIHLIQKQTNWLAVNL
jgi:hypothetical protein